MSRSAVVAGERGACAAAGAWVLCALLGLLALQGAASAAPRQSETYPECTGACDLGIGDRTRWRRIDPEAGLPDLRVRELEEATDGTLWVATDRGLRWYDGFTFHAVEGPPLAASSALAALRDGEVVAVFPGGLWRGGRERWTRIDLGRVSFPPAATAITHFTKIRTTDDGELLIEGRHSDGELRAHVLEGESWRQIPTERPLVLRPMQATDPHRGNMSFLTLEGGLLPVADADQPGALSPIPAEWLVTAVFPDPGGLGALVSVALPWDDRGLWSVGPSSRERVPGTAAETVVTLDTGVDGVALAVLVGGTFVAREVDGIWRGPFRAPPELDEASIVRFLRSGDLLAGGPKGLSWLQRRRSAWQAHEFAQSSAANQLVLTLLPTRSGDLWVGTAAGLERHDSNGCVQWIGELDGERLHDITALAEDDRGRLWIGSGSGSFKGIRVLDHGQVTRFDGPDLPLHVHAFVTDEQRRVWVAGLPGEGRPGGLWVYEDEEFRRIEELPDSIHKPLRVYDVSFGAGERMYVATGSGLFRVEHGEAVQLLQLDGERGGRVATVCSDGAGGAWFGHGEGAPGLGHVLAGGWIEYVEPLDGGREPRTIDLKRDGEGRLWVGDEDGLLVHGLGGLHRIEGRARGVQSVAVQAGRLLVGTRGGGVMRFDPSIAATFETRVDVQLDLVDRHTLVAGWVPRAYWSERPSAQMLTRFRLDDDEWSDWSIKRGARMTDLEPGEHSLAIEVLGTPLRTTPQRISKSITIDAPVWSRLVVAVPLMAVLFVVVVFAAWSTLRWIGAARAHREASARFEQLANNVRDVFWLVDWRTSEVLYVSPAYRSIAGPSRTVPHTAEEWAEQVHPSDRAWVADDYRDCIEREGEWDAELRLLRLDNKVIWVHVRAFAIRDAGGAIVRVAGITEEFTERREAEVRQQRLSLELDHRVKNVLAQVAAIAEQTAARATDLSDFSRAFIGRVRSMARTHEALSLNRWSGVPLREVIETALCPTVGDERRTLTGPPIVLTPRASTSLGLALHELGTNAAKYGALREACGTVEAAWQVDDGGSVVLIWTERGSPAVQTARGKGLGLSLVRGLIEHDLGGVVDLRFGAHGLVAELRIPGVVVPGVVVPGVVVPGVVVPAGDARAEHAAAPVDRAG